MELELTDFDLPDGHRQRADPGARAGRAGAASRWSATSIERLGEIRADERKVKQVLLNLLSNAMKFTPGGRPDRRPRARLVKECVEISVTDTGVGIAPGGPGGGLRGVPAGGDGGQEGGGHRARAGAVAEVRRAARRADLGHEPVGRGSTFTFTLPLRREEPILLQ